MGEDCSLIRSQGQGFRNSRAFWLFAVVYGLVVAWTLGEGALPGAELLPGHVGGVVGNVLHRDALRDGAHETAKVAADAHVFFDVDQSLAVSLDQLEGLVGAVFARYITKFTSDTLLMID